MTQQVASRPPPTSEPPPSGGYGGPTSYDRHGWNAIPHNPVLHRRHHSRTCSYQGDGYGADRGFSSGPARLSPSIPYSPAKGRSLLPPPFQEVSLYPVNGDLSKRSHRAQRAITDLTNTSSSAGSVRGPSVTPPPPPRRAKTGPGQPPPTNVNSPEHGRQRRSSSHTPLPIIRPQSAGSNPQQTWPQPSLHHDGRINDASRFNGRALSPAWQSSLDNRRGVTPVPPLPPPPTRHFSQNAFKPVNNDAVPRNRRLSLTPAPTAMPSTLPQEKGNRHPRDLLTGDEAFVGEGPAHRTINALTQSHGSDTCPSSTSAQEKFSTLDHSVVQIIEWLTDPVAGRSTAVRSLEKARKFVRQDRRLHTWPFALWQTLDDGFFSSRLQHGVYLNWTEDFDQTIPGQTFAPGVLDGYDGTKVDRVAIVLNAKFFDTEANTNVEQGFLGDDLVVIMLHQMVHAWFLKACGMQWLDGEESDGRVRHGTAFWRIMHEIMDVSRETDPTAIIGAPAVTFSDSVTRLHQCHQKDDVGDDPITRMLKHEFKLCSGRRDRTVCTTLLSDVLAKDEVNAWYDVIAPSAKEAISKSIYTIDQETLQIKETPRHQKGSPSEYVELIWDGKPFDYPCRSPTVSPPIRHLFLVKNRRTLSLPPNTDLRAFALLDSFIKSRGVDYNPPHPVSSTRGRGIPSTTPDLDEHGLNHMLCDVRAFKLGRTLDLPLLSDRALDRLYTVRIVNVDPLPAMKEIYIAPQLLQGTDYSNSDFSHGSEHSLSHRAKSSGTAPPEELRQFARAFMLGKSLSNIGSTPHQQDASTSGYDHSNLAVLDRCCGGAGVLGLLASSQSRELVADYGLVHRILRERVEKSSNPADMRRDSAAKSEESGSTSGAGRSVRRQKGVHFQPGMTDEDVAARSKARHGLHEWGTHRIRVKKTKDGSEARSNNDSDKKDEKGSDISSWSSNTESITSIEDSTTISGTNSNIRRPSHNNKDNIRAKYYPETPNKHKHQMSRSLLRHRPETTNLKDSPVANDAQKRLGQKMSFFDEEDELKQLENDRLVEEEFRRNAEDLRRKLSLVIGVEKADELAGAASKTLRSAKVPSLQAATTAEGNRRDSESRKRGSASSGSTGCSRTESGTDAQSSHDSSSSASPRNANNVDNASSSKKNRDRHVTISEKPEIKVTSPLSLTSPTTAGSSSIPASPTVRRSSRSKAAGEDSDASDREFEELCRQREERKRARRIKRDIEQRREGEAVRRA